MSKNSDQKSPATKLITAAVTLVVAVVVALGGGQLGGGSNSGSTSTSAGDTSTVAAQYESTEHVGNLEFRSEERLERHFEKHGRDMGFASAEEYLAGANAVVANPDALHKTESKDGDDVYFIEKTGEFVVVSQKGYIRTYFVTDRDYYDRQ